MGWTKWLGFFLILALGIGPAFAQSPVVTQPSSQAATNFSSTISVTNTFQSVFAASAKRQGCSIQNNGAHNMWVYFGDVAGATKAKSFILVAGTSLVCGSQGVVAKDQVSITGTAADAFTATQDGAPTVAGGGSGGGGGGGNVDIVSPVDANSNVKVSIFDSTGTALTYNANGQATAANSSPVVGATGTIAGGSTGTAGTAASTVVTVQGVTSMTPVQVSQATATNLNAAVVGTGTAGSAAGGVLTIQGVTSMTPVQVSQATAASLNATVVGTGTLAVQAQPTPVTSGGLSWYFVQPAASDNHVVIKAGAGQVYHIAATNNSATINYLRLYNATTGFNGCNSATNIVGQWAIPASTSGAGFVADITQGIAFSTGISICVSSGYATTDTTNATASAMSVNIGYK